MIVGDVSPYAPIFIFFQDVLQNALEEYENTSLPPLRVTPQRPSAYVKRNRVYKAFGERYGQRPLRVLNIILESCAYTFDTYPP